MMTPDQDKRTSGFRKQVHPKTLYASGIIYPTRWLLLILQSVLDAATPPLLTSDSGTQTLSVKRAIISLAS